MASHFPDKSRVVFYGDSVTRLGGGILRVAAQYRALFPERDVRFFNTGISGGTLEAAMLYFNEWVAPLHPTHIVLAFGVNDATSIFTRRLEDDDAESARIGGELASFRQRYAALLERIDALGAMAILRTITPFDCSDRSDDGVAPADSGKAETFRRVAMEIKKLAAERRLELIDDWTRMSTLLADGENDFMPDRIHPADRGQWRMAETFLASQGLPIAPYRPREKTAAEAELLEWEALSQRFANVLSAEWTFVRDESLDTDARQAKVRAWLDENEGKKGINPILFNFANDYLRDKPQVATLMAQIDRKL